MPNDPPLSLPFHIAPVCLFVLWVVVTPAFSADVIYTYVDDDGVPHFTDQWQLIPDKYRGKIQELDPSTGKPFKPSSARSESAPPQGSPSSLGARKEPAPPTAHQEPPFYAAWLEQFSNLSIPLPSQIQLGVGLMSVVVIWGALKIIRVSPNPLVKLMLKGVITAVLLGGAYSMYIMSLNERISGATRDTAPEKISGKEIIRHLQGSTEKASAAIKEKAKAPLEKIKDATVGGAVRARDLADQSNREKEKALQKIESGP